MSDQTSAPPKKPKGRSPAYPAINLEMAIQRARELWDKERQHLTPVETAVKHWGYKALSGPALGTLSALKKFGLSEDEGSGKARRTRLTDLAVDILENPDEGARGEAIQRAALNPGIHRQLWEKYSDQQPPSVDNLRWELIREMGFTERGADEFIPQYWSTIDFAGLTGQGGSGSADEQEDGHGEPRNGGARRSPPPPPERHQRRRVSDTATAYTIPLAGGNAILVEGEFPVTEQDWQQFLAVLNAMKPGLVRNDGDHGASE